MEGTMMTRLVAAAAVVLLCMPAFSVATSPESLIPINKTLATTTFVLVHGEGHGQWCWFQVATALQDMGFMVTTLDLASHGRDKTSPDDVMALQEYSKPLTKLLATASNKVIVVAHGLGGAAATYAMESYPEKIAKAVFVSAVMPISGQTALDPIRDYFNQILLLQGVINLNFGMGMLALPTSFSVNASAAPAWFYQRSPTPLVTLGTALIDTTPFRVFEETIQITPANYGRVDRYYIKSGLDKIISWDDQTKMIKANPVKMEFVLKNSDHASFFSETTYLLILLKNIATVL